MTVGTEDPVWFVARSPGAIGDFFEICDHSLDALEASARALERTVGALPGGGAGPHAADVRERMRHARAGDWRPFEHHLRTLGASYAGTGEMAAAWYGAAASFYQAIMPRLVEAFAAAPARLAAVLAVLGDYLERSLSIVLAGGAAAQAAPGAAEVAPEVLPAAAGRPSRRRTLHPEILSSTAHEFAAASGDIEALLTLVARRLGEIIGDGCAVRLLSDDGAWLEPSTSFHHADPVSRDSARLVLGSERQRIGEGIAGRVAATGVAELIPTVEPVQLIAAVPPAFRSMLASMDVSSALAVPLRSRDRTIGAISLLRTGGGAPYTLDDQHFAQEIADRAGLAIDNAVLVATLEQRVADRTAALEAANRELEAFSYSASHDLRTPLRAIDGFGRMLLADYQDKLDERGRHYLQRIRAGTQRMAALIDDLLNLSRITREPPRRASLDLSALAAELAAELRKGEPVRAVPIHIQPALRARADARLLRIVLENLLGNAWKFTARHPAAEIWFGANARTFHVRDTGAGFDMAYIEKLFVPFQRLHTLQEFDGNGVGLATVSRIVSHHGGRIWAEAEVGRGATFFFTLGDHS